MPGIAKFTPGQFWKRSGDVKGSVIVEGVKHAALQPMNPERRQMNPKDGKTWPGCFPGASCYYKAPA